MITGSKAHFYARLSERGYSLDDVRGCIVAEDQSTVTVDETHPAYPRNRNHGFVPPAEPPAKGPGTELKKLLKLAGITASPTCSCNARARTMDANGCDWCEANLDEIVGWLREEAAKRGLPFLDAVGKVLVRRAIKLARKDAVRGTQAQTGGEGSPAV